MSRCVAVKACYELLAQGHSHPQVATGSEAQLAAQRLLHDGQSWSLAVLALQGSMPLPTAAAIREQYAPLEATGPVRLKNPQCPLCVLVEPAGQLAQPSGSPLEADPDRELLAEPARVWLCRHIAQGGSHKVNKLDLSKRVYLGPTTLDPELGLLMCNLAQVRPGSFTWDPFLGTGSLAVAAAEMGARTLGSDIDVRVLRGKKGRNLAAVFKQYHLAEGDIIRADNAHSPLCCRPIFDAIVTDPPYGVRAGARKAGTPSGKTPIKLDAESRRSFVPRTCVYQPSAVMVDLLAVAAQTLVVGGRLAYLLPTTVAFDPRELPVHPLLELEHNIEQRLSMHLARRIIVLRKHSEWDPAQAESYAAVANEAALAAEAAGVGATYVTARIAELQAADAAALSSGSAHAAAEAGEISQARIKRMEKRTRRAAAAASPASSTRETDSKRAGSSGPPTNNVAHMKFDAGTTDGEMERLAASLADAVARWEAGWRPSLRCIEF